MPIWAVGKQNLHVFQKMLHMFKILANLTGVTDFAFQPIGFDKKLFRPQTIVLNMKSIL